MAQSISKKLYVMVGANIAGLKKGMGDAARSINGLGSAVNRSVGGVMGLAAGIVGVGFGVSKIKEVAEAMDNTAKSADRLNMTTEALAGLQHAAGLAGMAASEFDGAMSTMFKNVGMAAMGSGKAKKAIEELGLDPKKLSKLSGENQFKVIAQALEGVGDASIKAALSSKIFGDAGIQMLSVLEGGVPAIEAAQARVDELGASFSRIDAAKVEIANDALTEVGTVIKGIIQNLVVAMAPIVSQLATEFIEWSKSGKSWREITFNAVKAVTVGVAYLMDLIDYGKIAWHALKVAGNAVLYAMIKPIELFTKALLLPIELAKDYLPDAMVSAAADVNNTLSALNAEFVKGMKDSKDEIVKIWTGPAMSEKAFGWLDDANRKSQAAAEAIAAAKPKPVPFSQDVFNSVQAVKATTVEMKKQLAVAEHIREVNFAPNGLIRVGSAQADAAPFDAAGKMLEASTNKQIAIANRALDQLRKIEKNTTPDEDEEAFG